MTQNLQHLRFQLTGRIARIELAHPPLNLLTLNLLQELHQVLDKLMNSRSICAIAFTAAPGSRAFSAGIEITECQASKVYRLIETFHDTFRLLDEIGKPVVVAIDGAVLGGGCDLAAFADIVIATDRSTFTYPELKVGLFPPFASVFLPHVIGAKRAAELILTGAAINAPTAATWGLVSHVVAPEHFAAKTEEVLRNLSSMSAASLEMARRALHLNEPFHFQEALQRVTKIYLEQLMSLEDAAEGVSALAARRAPVWQDR